MIVKTTKEINGVEYEYTYSDAGFKVTRDGVEYDEAVDPIGTNREYTESSTPVEPPEEDPFAEYGGNAM